MTPFYEHVHSFIQPGKHPQTPAKGQHLLPTAKHGLPTVALPLHPLVTAVSVRDVTTTRTVVAEAQHVLPSLLLRLATRTVDGKHEFTTPISPLSLPRLTL